MNELTENEKTALARTDIILDSNTATWNIKMEGAIGGTYMGSFRFRTYLSPLQQVAADRERREILGPQPFAADEHAGFVAYALTQLKYRVISAPPFWNSASPAALAGDIPDEEVITAVLDAALNAEMKYKANIRKKKLELIERTKGAVEKLMEDPEESEDESDEEEND